MTVEMKLRDILDVYSDHVAMLDSKARLDREAIMERSNEYSRTELTQLILTVNMDYAQALNARQNRAIQSILNAVKGE